MLQDITVNPCFKFDQTQILDMEKKFEEDLRVARVDSTSDVRKLLTEMEEQVKEKNKVASYKFLIIDY